MASILDPKFKYVSAAKTDIRKTFARVRREMKEKEMKEKENVIYPIVLEAKKWQSK